MTSTQCRIVRRAAAGVGALALLLGAAACTGGDEEPRGSESSTAQEAAPTAGEDAQPTQEPTTTAPSDGGGESPFTEEELEAASQRFVEVLRVLDDQDWEAACGMVLDPTTGTAPEGERLRDCAEGAESAVADRAALLEPGVFDAVEPSMITARDNGDGTVSLSVLDEDLGIPMSPGEDGRWYLVIPF